jgi:hypothetical protein
MSTFFSQIAMPPKKKAKADAPRGKVGDFLHLLGNLVRHYERTGDAQRAKTFDTALSNISYAVDDHEVKTDYHTFLSDEDADEFLKVKGVGKTTVELMKEFIKTGTFERLENFRKVQKLPSEAFLSDLKKLGRIDKKFKTMKLKMYPDEDEKPDEWWEVEVHCAYSEYTSMEVFEEEEEYWEDIEKVKAKIKNDVYQQDQVWEGVVSKGDTRGTFKFIHHRDHDGDVELEGDLPEDCDNETLEEFLTEKLIHDCDSGDESYEGSEGEPDESYEGSEGEPDKSCEGSEGEPDKSCEGSEGEPEAELIEKFWETARTDLRAAIATLPEKYTLSVEGHFGRNAVIIGGVENRVLFKVEGKEYSFVWTEKSYDYNGYFPFEIHGEWCSATGKVKGTFTYTCENLDDGSFNYTSLAIEPEEFDEENNPEFHQGLLDACENIQGDYAFFTPE